MKLLNMALYAVLLGCSTTALAAYVNDNDAVSIPVSVSFAVPATSFSAEWLPTADLVAGSLSNGIALGHIQLSKPGTYAYRMANFTDANYPNQGSLIKEGSLTDRIPVVIINADGQKNIEPGEGSGIPGWTRHDNTISTLKLTLGNNAAVLPGTYRGAVEVATVIL